jgi:hypothetical protein
VKLEKQIKKGVEMLCSICSRPELAKDIWDKMCPEERVCNSRLKNLRNEVLEMAWQELPEHIQNHLRILLSED